jgi:hypothetical protein
VEYREEWANWRKLTKVIGGKEMEILVWTAISGSGHAFKDVRLCSLFVCQWELSCCQREVKMLWWESLKEQIC